MIVNHEISDNSILFDARGLCKSFAKRQVVRDLSIQVGPGEIVGLLGPNGAGKSTTFKMVLGILRPDSGSIHFRGEDVTRLPMYLRARRGIAYLPQDVSIFQRLTVEQNLLAVMEMQPKREGKRKERATQLLEEYGLTKVAKQKAYTLSGGEKRRLEICRSLLINPSLILLDEPFSGVDPIAVGEIQGFVKSLREQGIGVLLTDHNVRETLSITDRAYIISDGTVVKQGDRDEVLNDPLVRKVYLGESFQM